MQLLSTHRVHVPLSSAQNNKNGSMNLQRTRVVRKSSQRDDFQERTLIAANCMFCFAMVPWEQCPVKLHIISHCKSEVSPMYDTVVSHVVHCKYFKRAFFFCWLGSMDALPLNCLQPWWVLLLPLEFPGQMPFPSRPDLQ